MSEKAVKKTQPVVQQTFFFKIARVVLWLLVHTITPVRYYHKERLTQLDGPAIVIGNHQSMGDPIIIAASVWKKETTFMAKKELLNNGFVRWLMVHLHVIPVDRHNSDMNAMRSSIRLLKEEGVLGIFPEGTRHKEGVMEDLDTGAAMIALRSGAPIVPVYIVERYRPFHLTHCWVGDVIPTDDLRAEGINAETCAKLTGRMTETYVQLQQDYNAARASK